MGKHNRAPNMWDLAGLYEANRTMSLKLEDGSWVPARPLGLDMLGWRLRCAWAVFTGRADALVWPGDQ